MMTQEAMRKVARHAIEKDQERKEDRAYGSAGGGGCLHMDTLDQLAWS
jgi:hypothetical protein